MEQFAHLSTFALLIGLAIGLTGVFSLMLLFLFIKDWRSGKIW